MDFQILVFTNDPVARAHVVRLRAIFIRCLVSKVSPAVNDQMISGVTGVNTLHSITSTIFYKKEKENKFLLELFGSFVFFRNVRYVDQFIWSNKISFHNDVIPRNLLHLWHFSFSSRINLVIPLLLLYYWSEWMCAVLLKLPLVSYW